MLDLSDMKTAFDATIDSLGIPMIFETADMSSSFSIVAGFKTAGIKDEQIVNSYGVGAKIITVKSQDFAVPPIQYDVIGHSAEKYTIQDVQPVHLGTETIGYKLFIKGA